MADRERGAPSYEIDFLPSLHEVASKEDFQSLLQNLEEGLKSGHLPPVHVALLVKGMLERTDIYELISDESRAIGTRLWVLLALHGFQKACPPIFESVIADKAVA